MRVGSEEAPLAERARDVWVDGLIRRYLDMEQGEWGYRYQVPLWHAVKQHICKCNPHIVWYSLNMFLGLFAQLGPGRHGCNVMILRLVGWCLL